MAFTNALLGIVHSLAHKTGAAFECGHIPHGCANAIYLPYVIEYNAKNAAERYADIARAAGLAGSGAAALTRALIEKINAYNVKLGIPKSLKDWGVPEADFKAKVAGIAKEAVGDACTGSNPRPIAPPEMEKLLDSIYYGKAVDF
jgi:alcohol dehydrogenase class IV